MAIYHCSIKMIKRSEGRSAVAAAAYHSGTRLTNEWDGMIHDYTKKGGIVHSEILLPANAPASFSDRFALWNSVEKIEKSCNAQLAREIEVAIPNELPRSEQIKLVQDYCAPFANDGMCVDFSIHAPVKEQENVHAHIMLTIRPLKANGEWDAKCRKEYDLDERGQRIPDGKGGWKNHRVNLTDWNEQTKAEEWRAAWAERTNQALERNGIHERIDHRSYKRQGVEQIPTIHMGVAASQMEKRGIVTDKGNINREIAQQNRLLKEIKARLTRLHNWSKAEMHKSAESAAPANLQSLLTPMIDHRQSEAPATRGGRIRALKDSASLLLFLQSNKIESIEQLHSKIDAMQTDYYALNSKIRQTERQIATLTEKLEYWEKYSSNKGLVKRIATLRPKAQERERESHRAEIILYEAAERFLSKLKESGERIAPKQWKAEKASLTATKATLYTQLKSMREDIKATESIRKAVEPQKARPQNKRKDDLQR